MLLPTRLDTRAALGRRVKIQSTPPRTGSLSSKDTGAAALDNLNLLGGQDGAPETRGQLVPIKEHALGGLDRPKCSGGGSSYAVLAEAGPCLLERAILLRSLAVLGEGVGGAAGEVCGERVGWAGGVRLGCVVDGRWNRALSDELDGGDTLRVGSCLAKGSCGKHCGSTVVLVLSYSEEDRQSCLWSW